jgi:hypothetical protein
MLLPAASKERKLQLCPFSPGGISYFSESPLLEYATVMNNDNGKIDLDFCPENCNNGIITAGR